MEDEQIDVTTLDEAALNAQLASDEDEGTPEGEETEVETEVETPEVETAEVPETKEESAKPEDEEKARLEKQVKDKEEFIGRQTTEIGELRRQAQILAEQLAAVDQEGLNRQWNEDPSAVVNEVLAVREKEAQANRLLLQANIKENEITIKQRVPDFDDMIDDIAITAKKDGASDDIVRAFKANPYGAQPDLVIQLSQRVKLEKENASLKAEVERLKKAPGEALKKVEAAARQVVTGGTGKSGAGVVAKANVAQMTNAQLEELLNQPDDE